MPEQRTFDFPRAIKLRWLERMSVPHPIRPDGTRIRMNRVKHLLKAVDSFARDAAACRVKRKTLASCLGCHLDTVSRAIADCELLGLLTCVRFNGQWDGFHLAIDWTAIERFVPSDAGPDPPLNPPQLAANPPQLAANPPQLAGAYTPLKRNGKRHGSDDGVLKSGKGGWPWDITVDRLRSPSGVQQMFDFALLRRWCHQGDRLRFFTLAASIARRANPADENEAGRWFTGSCRRKIWSGGQTKDTNDELWAEKAISQLDRKPALPRVSNLAGPQLTAAVRDDAISRLQAWSAARRTNES